MRQLLFACIVIAAAAAAAPGLFTRYIDRQSGAVSPAEELASAERASSSVSARQVSIEAERDGHFYVDAEINFRPVRLMVDTGATVIALRQSDAAAAGIRPRRADFEHPVQTANGTAYAAAASLDSVAVRDIEVSGVRALILPDDKLSMSLLGGSFLNRLARFEVADGTLIFEN
jgi:aspartyl protease family protein